MSEGRHQPEATDEDVAAIVAVLLQGEPVRATDGLPLTSRWLEAARSEAVNRWNQPHRLSRAPGEGNDE